MSLLCKEQEKTSQVKVCIYDPPSNVHFTLLVLYHVILLKNKIIKPLKQRENKVICLEKKTKQ